MISDSDFSTTLSDRSGELDRVFERYQDLDATYGGLPCSLQRRLGQGAEGMVFAASVTQADGSSARLALKVGDSTDDGFGQEAQLLAGKRLRGTAPPQGPFPFETADGAVLPAVHMALLKGQNLETRYMASGVTATPDETASILGSLTRTLRDAEAEGLVHRDIKPSNVIHQAGEDRTFLVDWGMAGRNGERGEAGTYAYMAPEIARNEPASAKADIFSTAMLGTAIQEGASPRQLPNSFLRPGFVPSNQAFFDWVGQDETRARSEHPLLDMALQRASHPDVEQRSSPLDLMTDLAAFDSARKHYSDEDLAACADHLVARCSDPQTRHQVLDANAARGLLSALGDDHPHAAFLSDATELAPDLRETAPVLAAAEPTAGYSAENEAELPPQQSRAASQPQPIRAKRGFRL